MIRDVADFRRSGVASRRVAELDIPVETWRATMCGVAHRDGARLRTFVLPPTTEGSDEAHGTRTVLAVRIDPPPDRAGEQNRTVRWWRVDELGMPVHRWRAVLHRAARREQARVHTFLVSVRGTDQGAADELAYVVWAEGERIAPPPATPSRPVPAPRSVTDLARFAAARRHPSAAGRHDIDDRGP